jgi:pimeloyl-ACP methyl ester carboxylesterase
MPLHDINGGKLYYEVHGSGFPVLLFGPGFLSSRIERWRTNPARPGVAQDWLDPIAALSSRFTLIALDVRNAGASRAAIRATDDWRTYDRDHLALLDHLGVKRCHAMGACIGVSFALGLAQQRPGLVTSMVLQNPIGLSNNRAAIDSEFGQWAQEMEKRPDVDPRVLPAFHQRMFGGDFIFSVSREFVQGCTIPMLLMPGDDTMHPAPTSADLARAPSVEVLSPWKGAAHRDAAMRRAGEFFAAHTPAP